MRNDGKGSCGKNRKVSGSDERGLTAVEYGGKAYPFLDLGAELSK